ncbi:type II toxin-antitoxin system HicA family toxin [Persicitalea sp.]|uniref:type II toxin-antitoxin system HicA family toxin n=1 Tax=Persicitalea sp. TaxID=3100273 RepID=UPI0035936662
MIKLIERDGWYQARQKGSHRQFKHFNKKGLVTINGKPSDDLTAFLENSILKQAGLK